MPKQTPRFAELLYPDLRRVYIDEMAADDLYGVRVKAQKAMAEARRAVLDAEAARVLKDAMRLYPQNPLDRPARKKAVGWALVGPVTCVRESPKAVCVRFDGAETWVPRSQLHATENEIKQVGDQGMLILPLWLAQEKGWIPT